MKTRIAVLWHEPSNFIATYEIRRDGGLPLLAICDGEYSGINPFYAYPVSWLTRFGWIMIGEL